MRLFICGSFTSFQTAQYSQSQLMKRFSDNKKYLRSFPQNQHSIYFEDLISEAVARLLFLDYYNHNNDAPSVIHKVVWNGTITPPQGAPSGSDAIACCYGFHLLIEPTMKTGANQMTQEFAPALRHCTQYCRQHNLTQNEVFSVLICPDIYIDTYNSIKHNHPNNFFVVPITVSHLEKILQTTILAFTIRHIEIKRLLLKISENLVYSTSLDNYIERVNTQINNWQAEILKIEKNHFIAVKSYEAIKKIGGNVVGMSQIIKLLYRHPIVNQYCNIIEEKITPNIIENSLTELKLACSSKTYTNNETFFEPVPFRDFESRNLRFIDYIKNIQ